MEEARTKSLQELGITEKELKLLEEEARATITEDTETEYGLVQIIFDKPVRAIRGKHDFKKRLKLIRRTYG